MPLFAGLDAARIAEIARLLKREVVPANYVIVRRGERADAMFFIMSGEATPSLFFPAGLCSAKKPPLHTAASKAGEGLE